MKDNLLYTIVSWETPNWPYTDTIVESYSTSLHMYNEEGKTVTLLVILNFGDLYYFNFKAE